MMKKPLVSNEGCSEAILVSDPVNKKVHLYVRLDVVGDAVQTRGSSSVTIVLDALDKRLREEWHAAHRKDEPKKVGEADG